MKKRVYIAAAVAVVAAVGAAVLLLNIKEPKNIYFNAMSADWRHAETISCYITECGSDSAESIEGKNDKNSGVYRFDIRENLEAFESDKDYSVVFVNDRGEQTYDLLIDESCVGDTVYCDGTMYEDSRDSNKVAKGAFWTDKSADKYGPILSVSTLGNVVGSVMRPHTTESDMLIDFLKNNLETARLKSDKTDQELIDNLSKSLRLDDAETEAAIKESGVTVDWSLANKKWADSSDKNSSDQN